MATMDYVDIPAGATRLRSGPTSKSTGTNTSTSKTRSDIRLAPRVFTALPHPSPPASPNSMRPRQTSISLTSTAANLASLSSPTMSFIPQLLMSSAMPSAVAPAGDSSTPQTNGTSTNPRLKLDPEKYTLMSTRDPLSLPIMTTNFRRFVSKIGPVFWLQDRVEEIVLWKKGWKVTCTWMSIYAFLCFFPRLILLVPHAALIAIILSTYPYPAEAEFSTASSDSIPDAHHPQPAAEGSVPWQANIQAIQNLMGVVSDVITQIEPYTYHLVLSPAHFRDAPPSRASPSAPVSAYTPHILTLLVCSFPILALIISIPAFPIRDVCLFGGLAPLVLAHPYVRKVLPYAGPAVQRLLPVVLAKVELAQVRLRALLQSRWGWKNGLRDKEAGEEGKEAPDDDNDTGEDVLKKAEDTPAAQRRPLSMVLQRLMDDDRLTDRCWNSEMREVELWENERFGGTTPESPNQGGNGSVSGSGGSTSAGALAPGATTNGWSKANLRPGERTAWTRGRDGWSGVGAGGIGGGGVEGYGEVSSNLTFSLASGWAFVETEDWRKDKLGGWSGAGADDDGWVYTNDAWLGARPAPYTAGGGSVTRRRRWTRRVWYDVERAKREE